MFPDPHLFRTTSSSLSIHLLYLLTSLSLISHHLISTSRQPSRPFTSYASLPHFLLTFLLSSPFPIHCSPSCPSLLHHLQATPLHPLLTSTYIPSTSYFLPTHLLPTSPIPSSSFTFSSNSFPIQPFPHLHPHLSFPTHLPLTNLLHPHPIPPLHPTYIYIYIQ